MALLESGSYGFPSRINDRLDIFDFQCIFLYRILVRT